MILIKSNLVFVPALDFKGKKITAFINPNEVAAILDNVQESGQKSNVMLKGDRCLLCTWTAQEAFAKIYSTELPVIHRLIERVKKWRRRKL